MGTRTAEPGARALLHARWALVAAALLAATPTPLSRLWGISATPESWMAWALSALWVAVSVSERRWPSAKREAALGGAERAPLGGAGLLLDVAFLTGMLAVSGAAENPLTLLYFVPITLSTLLSQGWTLRVASAAVLGFASLLALTARAAGEHLLHTHHQHMFRHVLGMAIALALVGLLVTVFVHRIARVLGAQREEIARLVRAREADRVATSLGALAAGAAHELGTPLGTVQLLAEDLPELSPDEQRAAVDGILRELGRMKEIVHGMDSSVLSGQVLASSSPWRLGELEDEVPLSPAGVVSVTTSGDRPTTQPRAVLAQILRELLENACRICPSGPVEVELSTTDAALCVAVRDRGPGLDPEQAARAVEPFVSTTGGRGLGLFLAHVHARQLGGALLLLPREGGGTSVELHLPLGAPGASAAPRARLTAAS